MLSLERVNKLTDAWGTDTGQTGGGRESGGAHEMRRTVIAEGKHGSFKDSEPPVFWVVDKSGVYSVLVYV